MALAEVLRTKIEATPGLAEVLGSLLDRYAVSGRLPQRSTLHASSAVALELKEIFSVGAVQDVDDGHVRLLLKSVCASLPGGETALAEALASALGRPLHAETGERASRLALRSGLLELLTSARHESTRRYLRSSLAALATPESELSALASERGDSVALGETASLTRAMDAALDNGELMRVQRFSALALGDSKALRWGGELFKRLSTALYEHSPETRARVLELGDPVSEAAARDLALEAHGVYRDVAAASALCFGPLLYEKGADRYGDVARHAARGECARLTVSQLANATVQRPRFRRVSLIENLTPFLDYVDALADAGVEDELAVCTGGQASWAVVRLMRLLTPFRLDMRCACDLDRSGVMIWRSLMKRGGVRLAPWHLDAATLETYASRGQPLSRAERRRIEARLSQESAEEPGHELLRALLQHDVWLEQEAFSDESLLDDVDRGER